MSLFLAGCPLWVTGSLLVLLPAVLAMCGLVLVRRHVGLARLAHNNEVAGFKFAVVGVIYAVMLAFAVVVVWQRYNDAELAVIQEAGAAATLYRLAAGPEPEAAQTRDALTNYLRSAIASDWPAMAREKVSPEVTAELNALYAAALRLSQGGRPAAEVTEMFYQLDQMTQARRSRLHLCFGVVPIVLWHALILGGALTVAFTFFFGTRNLRAQMLMTGVLAIIVFMGLFVIVSIEHPFTGPVHVGSGPLLQVLADFVAAQEAVAAH
ncbi:MAG TPA: hypothetical protein VEC10_13660 [Steroidobacteraceae bacterium]|nr:hypothetical protein [Steroidobacteraceae bacterium]